MNDAAPRFPLAEIGIALSRARDVSDITQLLHTAVAELEGVQHVRIAARSLSEAATVTDSEQDHIDGRWYHTDEHSGEDRWSLELCVGIDHEIAAIAAPVAGVPGAGPLDACALFALQASAGLQWLTERTELARAELQQEALVESGKALSSERSLDGVLQQIVEHAKSITGARYGALGVLEAGSSRLTRFVTSGIDQAGREAIGDFPTGHGILGVLIDDPRPLRLVRLQDDPRSVGFPENHPPMTTFLGVPIITSGTVAGRIYLTEKGGGIPFTADDERLVQVLASQAAIAIDNATLNDRLQHTAAALAEASRHKSIFMANMSHELRSPLNTIIGYTRLLLEDSQSLNDEQLEDLKIVRGSGEHLLELITDLLDLQKIEAGRISLVLAQEELITILDAVAASVQPSVPDGVKVVLDVSDLKDDQLWCDRTRVRQILLNVLGNALKFTTHGEVRLAARDDGGAIRIVVSDTGPGIPLADQPRIFESFYQSSQALERTPNPREGAGLGLAITKLLAELHGGSVQLNSREGEGTQITIRLPRDGGRSISEQRP